MLELIRKEGDDPNYEFPENFFSDAGDWLHEELEAREQERNQPGGLLRPGIMRNGRRYGMRNGHMVVLSDDDGEEDDDDDDMNDNDDY